MKIIETGLYGMATITLMSIIVIYASECENIIPCTNCTTGTTDEAAKATAAYKDEIKQFIEWDCPES